MKKLIITSTVVLCSITSFAMAKNIHTDHHIYAQNESSNIKPWDVRITDISPSENAFFVLHNVTSNDVTVSVSKDIPVEYGFGFTLDSDFNVAYTISAVDLTQKSDAMQHKTKSCTFVVSANGPANPNISVTNYQGANCTYKVIPGVGEDFYLA